MSELQIISVDRDSNYAEFLTAVLSSADLDTDIAIGTLLTYHTYNEVLQRLDRTEALTSLVVLGIRSVNDNILEFLEQMKEMQNVYVLVLTSGMTDEDIIDLHESMRRNHAFFSEKYYSHSKMRQSIREKVNEIAKHRHVEQNNPFGLPVF